MVGPGGLQAGRNGALGPGGGIVFAGNRKVGGGAAFMPQMFGGALIGKIGEDGEPFLVSDRYEGQPDREGMLFLQIVQSPWGCPSSGSYDVKITRKD